MEVNVNYLALYQKLFDKLSPILTGLETDNGFFRVLISKESIVVYLVRTDSGFSMRAGEACITDKLPNPTVSFYIIDDSYKYHEYSQDNFEQAALNYFKKIFNKFIV